MANTTQTRTETKRHEATVNGTDVIKGDRISKALVAKVPGQLGQRINPHEDGPETQLVAVTEIHNYDDVHSALLLDPDTETWIRASRHDSQQAWSQAEADWTVKAVGNEIVVTDGDVDERPDDEQDVPESQYMKDWVDILFDELRGGHFDISDERKLNGTGLKLYDPYGGRKGYATIELED